MKLTRLLAALLIIPFAFVGCGEKEEPTIGDEVGDAVDEAADEGGKALDDAKGAIKDAIE